MVWLRSLFAGGFAFFLGVGGHALDGGPVPSTAWLAVLFAATVCGSAPFLSGPPSTRRLVLLLGGGQSAIHVALTWSPPGILDLALHLGAAALVAAWLAYGERRLVAALLLMARHLVAWTRLFVPVPGRAPHRTTPATAAPRVVVEILLGRAVSRRGPPFACA